MTRYELGDIVGSGGAGVVYRAHDRRLQQTVAIKVMHTRDSDPRFEQEMLVLSRLHHPHIVQIMDADCLPDGTRFAVLEWVAGRTLAEVLDHEGSLSPEETRFLMAQVLDAMACAHERGIIHRDLKPANIMLTEGGGRRNVVVLDFGIASLLDAPATPTDVFSPLYAAPEQLEDVGPQGPHTDIYAWGLVYLECLSGRPVVQGRSMTEVLLQQCSPTPHPLPDKLQNTSLGELLAASVHKDPRARPTSALELLGALEVQDSARHPAPPPSSRRTPLTWLALVLVAMLGLALTLERPTSATPRPAVSTPEAHRSGFEDLSTEALRTLERALRLTRLEGLRGPATSPERIRQLEEMTRMQDRIKAELERRGLNREADISP